MTRSGQMVRPDHSIGIPRRRHRDAACAAALTVYDMLKSVDRGMVIEHVRLEHKSGGKSGTWERRKSG